MKDGINKSLVILSLILVAGCSSEKTLPVDLLHDINRMHAAIDGGADEKQFVAEYAMEYYVYRSLGKGSEQEKDYLERVSGTVDLDKVKIYLLDASTSQDFEHYSDGNDESYTVVLSSDSHSQYSIIFQKFAGENKWFLNLP